MRPHNHLLERLRVVFSRCARLRLASIVVGIRPLALPRARCTQPVLVIAGSILPHPENDKGSRVRCLVSCNYITSANPQRLRLLNFNLHSENATLPELAVPGFAG